MKDRIVVVGGGVAGLASSLALSYQGMGVLLIDRNFQLGGRTIDYSCKAEQVCVNCGVCEAHYLARRVQESSKIEIWLRTDLLAITEEEKGNYLIKTSGLNKSSLSGFRAVIDARGGCSFPAEAVPEYGYKRYPGIITNHDLEQIWKDPDVARGWMQTKRRLAFIQCVGSRTRKAEGNSSCSRYCCRAALRWANKLCQISPEVVIDIYHMGLNVTNDDLQTISGEERIRLRRGLPAQAYALRQRLFLLRERASADSKAEEEYDAVILSIGLKPLPVIIDSQPGIFSCGSVREPGDIFQAIRAGEVTAGQVIQYCRYQER